MTIFSNWISPLRESIIEAYSVEWERTVSLQKIALQELSASLIPVFEKISVMPFVGTIDTERAKLIMENLLEGVVKQRAEVVLTGYHRSSCCGYDGCPSYYSSGRCRPTSWSEMHACWNSTRNCPNNCRTWN